MSVFTKGLEHILSSIEDRKEKVLEYPIKKLGNLFNGYNDGDLILLGGRKTGGKGALALNNYVTYPLRKLSKGNEDFRIVYYNNKLSLKNIMEKMIVNIYSHATGGSKMSIPSLYGLEGVNLKVTKAKSESIVTQVMQFLETQEDKRNFSLLTGRRSISEFEVYIDKIMQEYGTLGIDDDVFTLSDEFDAVKVIVTIDDINGLQPTDGFVGDGSKADIALRLRALAKLYNIIIVCTVPVEHKALRGPYVPSTNDLAPYIVHADRAAIIYSPLEVNLNKSLNYTVSDWINNHTGVCYIRNIFIAANSMGASSVYSALFMYPENGYFKQLPRPEEDEIEDFRLLVNS
ncbi:MAG: hypothetical protein KAH32_01770 [Chlamydiia bacterium]|nr:hypothetical protein [Chlamydiia bacterium]